MGAELDSIAVVDPYDLPRDEALKQYNNAFDFETLEHASNVKIRQNGNLWHDLAVSDILEGREKGTSFDWPIAKPEKKVDTPTSPVATTPNKAGREPIDVFRTAMMHVCCGMIRDIAVEETWKNMTTTEKDKFDDSVNDFRQYVSTLPHPDRSERISDNLFAQFVEHNQYPRGSFKYNLNRVQKLDVQDAVDRIWNQLGRDQLQDLFSGKDQVASFYASAEEWSPSV